MGAGHAGGENGGTLGLHGHHLHLRVPGLQILPHTGDGAAGADTGHEVVHLAVGILIDLRAGGLEVRLGIGGIDKLTGDKAAGDLTGQLLRLGNGAAHALGALRQHQFGAVGLHQLAALHAHGLRHDDDDPIATGGGHGGQTDAGITGSRLDDNAAGLQQALRLCVVDHGTGDTILHGAGGVEILQLAQQPGLQTVRLLQMGQLQQGSVADELIGRGINAGHNSASFPCGKGR